MRRVLPAAFLLLVVSGHDLPALAIMPVEPQGLLCRAAVATAERAGGIPPHLLAAISRVESGRPDPVTGAVHPWPWTANAEGQGYFYADKAEAVSAVRAMQARGVRSIDVGCAQVNLQQHPDAFPNLETAFDPTANEAYAAHFLRELYAQTGDWTKAAAQYHSATPEYAADYQRKVLAAWPLESQLGNSYDTSPLARAWAATISAPVATFTHVLASGPRMMAPPPAAQSPQGRGLDAYRATPIRFAYQPPPRRLTIQ